MSGNVYLHAVEFNQDYTCFACATTGGFRVYTLNPFQEAHRRERVGNEKLGKLLCPFKIATMLFKTNLFALVDARSEPESVHGVSPVVENSTFRVRLWDDSRKNFVGEIRSRHDIKGVYMLRDIIVVVTEYNIYVYTTDNLNAIFHINTVGNPRGTCALVSDSKPWILACPGNSIGTLRIQQGAEQEGHGHEFSAHKTNLAHISANQNGTLFATASETGTVIKVFDRSGHCLHELRRGTQTVLISCLTFRKDNKYLAAASSSATIHIFELEKDDSNAGLNHQAPATQNISEAINAAMPKYFQPGRAAAFFRIPDVDHSDLRANTNCNIVGPQVCFAGVEDAFYVLHYTGLLYEVKFHVKGKPAPSQLSRIASQVSSQVTPVLKQIPNTENLTKVLGEEDLSNCTIVDTTTWFASRPEFKVYRKDKTKEHPSGVFEADFVIVCELAKKTVP